MINAKPMDTLMDPSVKLVLNHGESCFDPGRYKRLVSKLKYLNMTSYDIAIVVNIVSQKHILFIVSILFSQYE